MAGVPTFFRSIFTGPPGAPDIEIPVAPEQERPPPAPAELPPLAAGEPTTAERAAARARAEEIARQRRQRRGRTRGIATTPLGAPTAGGRARPALGLGS